MIELTDDQLSDVNGGYWGHSFARFPFYPGFYPSQFDQAVLIERPDQTVQPVELIVAR